MNSLQEEYKVCVFTFLLNQNVKERMVGAEVVNIYGI